MNTAKTKTTKACHINHTGLKAPSRWRNPSVLCALALALCLLAGNAFGYSRVDRNRNLFEDRDIITSVLSLAHMTSTFQGGSFEGVCSVSDGHGNTVPEEYALKYTYHWTSSFDGGTYDTQVVYFFDRFGNLDDLSAKTPGAFIAPFLGSSAMVTVIIEAMRSDVENKGTPQEKAAFEMLARSKDTEQLCLFSLKLYQRLH